MDSRPVVFDISSDEECWGETGRGNNTGGGGGDGYDWISEFFRRESEDSDDVELVGEVVLNPKPRPKSSSVAEKLKDFDDDDDECVILDGDPDKPVVIEKDNASDSDDLLIVGEKGQIACRDYPHPRHLCAKFPFTSTPHHRHCHLCHCYVCDSLAPCVKWGNATSNIDHCHATDKHEYWKLQRRNLKQGDNAPPPVPKLPIRSVPRGPPQTIPIPQLPPPPPPPLAPPLPPPPPPPPPLAPPPPLSLAPPPPSLRQYVSHHQVSRPTTIRPCSTSANSSIPNTTNQGRIQQPPFVNSGNKFLPHLVSQQLPSTHSNIHRRDRSHSVGNLVPQFTNSHAIFKKAGTAGGGSTTYRSGYTSSNNNHATQYFRNSSPMAASNNRYYSRRREFSSRMSSDANACRAPSLPNTGSRFGNSVPSYHQVSSHPNRQGVNSVPSQPIVSSDLNTVLYPQASSQPNMGSSFEYSAPSQPHEISQPNMGSSFISPELSQHQVYSQSIPVSNDGHNGPQNPLDEFSDFNLPWDNPTCETNQQPLADDSVVQSAGVTEFAPQIHMSINVGSPDFHYDSWMLENQPVSGTLEVPVPSGFDVYSPESAHLESSFLFDF
ncbi:hypothetical protein RHSIM_Rhsim13G0040600 [Rhododendron simsii]|uniref:Uncharacterized protein n=1 Tax=Rhododendron simsii TaxID=118357 RepID=A0A834FZH7_RHOSS|nr:hypothetical protein RHSIM_Rhsim13G0040600 [Rhododendron simsii]